MASYARGRNAVGIGVLAIVAGGVFLGLFAWLTERGLSRHQADLYVELPTAVGLKKGDPVLYRGISIGRVGSIEIAPGGVLVQARLSKPPPITADGAAALEAMDVFGTQAIVLRDGSPAAPPVVDGDTLRGASVPSLAARANELGAQAERLLGDTTLALVHGSLDGAARAALQLEGLLSLATSVLGAQAADLTAATASVAAVAGNLEEVTRGEHLGRTLANLERATANLVAMTSNMDAASAAFARALEKLDRGEGTAGRMLNDPALYESLFSTVGDLETLVQDIRANPKRYLSVSVF